MIYQMRNPIMPYVWGSRTAIAQLQGRPVPAAEPEAELWMGSHPKAPSEIRIGDRWVALDQAIADDPQTLLGAGLSARYDNQLPFLVKVLAAGAPLSIQAHPDTATAAEGFDRENRAGISMDDPRRNFKDPRHKPELICALTPFWALCGFRPLEEILDLFERFCPATVEDLIAPLTRGGASEWLRAFTDHWFRMEPDQRQVHLDEASAQARNRLEDPVAQWILQLSDAYPGDLGILMPMILNLVRLEPGQALALEPCVLHAYLNGVGIEVMANSDNVLRGGLTPKHVDVALLLDVVRFEPFDAAPVPDVRVGSAETRFESNADEFCLSRIRVDETGAHTQKPSRSPEIFLVFQGDVTVMESGSKPLELKTGESLFVAADSSEIAITGNGELFKTTVPAVG